MKKLLSVAVLSLLAFAGTVVAQDNPIYLGVTVGYNSFLSADASLYSNGFAAEAESPSWTDKGACWLAAVSTVPLNRATLTRPLQLAFPDMPRHQTAPI